MRKLESTKRNPMLIPFGVSICLLKDAGFEMEGLEVENMIDEYMSMDDNSFDVYSLYHVVSEAYMKVYKKKESVV